MSSIAKEMFAKVTADKKERYDTHRSILSFEEYLEEVESVPKNHLRNAAGYLLDVVEYFGSSVVKLPTGTRERFKLFDLSFDDGRGRVVGQEQVQERVVRMLRNFVRAGKIDRLLLLHGPNGSAKTSLVQALSKAAEEYSECDDGALYRFNWVFPTSSVSKGSLGFGGGSSQKNGSYAYLEGKAVEAVLPCEFKDHPILLLDKDSRNAFFKALVDDEKLPRNFTLPEVLTEGNLSTKNRAIFDALLTHYHGNLPDVLRHIQVERFYLSRRYRRGVVGVEPQMSVDAYSRQVTADRSLSSLPVSLQHLSLYQTGGPLNDANRGILEFSDLLKRPVEAWKYLLMATEQAQANLDTVNLFLDSVMLATTNELHLSAFKEHPDWASFKARMELITAPYLLRASEELAIYQEQVPSAISGLHVAPHALEIASRFAVLTRLEPPLPARYDEKVRVLIESLSPEEKLELYDTGSVPERLAQRQRRDLREVAEALYDEYRDSDVYEGRFGASVREIRGLLFNAAQHADFDHLSPQAVLDELRALVKEKSTYDYLRREVVRKYRDTSAFVEQIEAWYLSVLDEDVRQAMGLVEKNSHSDLFNRYLMHISAWTKKEKLPDPVTGKMAEPDELLMRQVEDELLANNEKSDDFRKDIISQIGAYRLENPDNDVDYQLLFGAYLRRLEENFYASRRDVIERLEKQFLKLIDNDVLDVDAKELEQAKLFQKNLFAAGYNESSARQAIAFLLRHRNKTPEKVGELSSEKNAEKASDEEPISK
ncbi:MAG: serine protein kinase PrkA [Deltaproteobacteria bacterium]|nr:serine protein kinase PrkA [Deltaproteobacteria bacterium]